MADDGSAQGSTWSPKFRFKVIFGTYGEVYFSEITGLEIETQVIEYKHNDSKQYSPIKMPGLEHGYVTLKKGVFTKDNKFSDWYSAVQMNTIKRETVVIQLLDEAWNPTVTWTLINAWPSKISSTYLKPDSNEVAIETIELIHEGLTIKND